MNGLVYRNGEHLVATGSRPFIENLDSIPFPARQLLPPLSEYQPSLAAFKRRPQATMVTSRGCPFRCAFCDHSVFGNQYRARTGRNVVDEIEQLITHFGAREIRFWDDTFNMNQQRVLDICDEIGSRNMMLPGPAWREWTV